MNFVKSPQISKTVSYPEVKVFDFGNFGLERLNRFLPRFNEPRKSVVVSYSEAKVFESGNFGLESLNRFLPRFTKQRKRDDVPSTMIL
jgi:hypothetical protein